MGAPPDVLRGLSERLDAQRRAATVPVWPEHWHALRVFLLMGTQWVGIPYPNGRIHWLGLNYAALDKPLAAAAELVEVQQHQPIGVLMEQLRVLERAAVEIRNE